MSAPRKQRRVSREEWLKAGLELLSERGIGAVKIDHLARRVGVAKTGFYWHFKDRQALLDTMLEFWEREYTGIIANDKEIAAMPARERLLAINAIVDDRGLTRLDAAISAWARQDPKAARLLAQTYKVRLKTLRKAFRDLGFQGDELEMRTRLFVCYVSNEAAMFGGEQTARGRRMRKLRNRLLIQKLIDS